MPQNPYRYHAMVTLNHSCDHVSNNPFCVPEIDGEKYTHPNETKYTFIDIIHDNLTDAIEKSPFVEYIESVKNIIDKAIKPGPFEYGVAVFEKGGAEDSDNWHCHIAFKGKWNYTSTPDKLHKTMKKAFKDKPQHIDITYKHHATGITWQWNDMVDYLIKQTGKKPDGPLLCCHPIFFGTKNVDGEEQVCSRENIYDTDELTVNHETIRDAKKANKPYHEVLESLAIVDDSLQYRKLIDYYKALPPPTIKLLDEDIKLYKWQANVIEWVQKPLKEGENGLWLNLESGAGKTVVLKWLLDNYDVFIPGMRPTGDYDCLSLMGYQDEPILLFNEMQPAKVETSQGTLTIWKRGFQQLLKQACDVYPIAFNFGGQREKIVPKCKVIITSNYDMPDDPGIRRRFTNYKSAEDTYATQSVESIPITQSVVTTTLDYTTQPTEERAKKKPRVESIEPVVDDEFSDIEPDNI